MVFSSVFFWFNLVGFFGVTGSVAQFVMSTFVTVPISVGFSPVTVTGPNGVGFSLPRDFDFPLVSFPFPVSVTGPNSV